MKANKLICLDTELLEKLKDINNVSKLINDLLTDYLFQGYNLKKDEIKGNIKLAENVIKEKKQLIDNLKDKLKELEKREQLDKEIFKNIPEDILMDFRAFPKMTEEVLLNRYNEVYFGRVSWEELIKAYNKHYNKEQ